MQYNADGDVSVVGVGNQAPTRVANYSESSVIPMGQLQGIPCLEVPVDSLNLANPLSLANLVTRTRKPGQGVVRLTGEIPWGDYELDKLLLAFMDDPRCGQMDLWTLRDSREQDWPTPDLWTVLEMSHCFEAKSVKELTARVDNLPMVPSPEEILVVDPAAKALQDNLLDEVLGRLDASVGWIYTSDPDVYDRAVRVVSRCYTRWAVRWNHE